MAVWVKICGNTSLADARLAIEAGADAVGFVFAPSPRQVTASEVAAIASRLPASVEKIGVFVDAPLDEIYLTVRECKLTGVQLHFDAAPELPAKLRLRLGPGVRILRVVHFGVGVGKLAAALAADPHVDALLVDSRTKAAVGGTGAAFDWEKARRTVFTGAKTRKGRLVAAGGLTPENVGEAIEKLRPWGVDAVSGVEAEPGKKDAVKVRLFVARARAAGGKTARHAG